MERSIWLDWTYNQRVYHEYTKALKKKEEITCRFVNTWDGSCMGPPRRRYCIKPIYCKSYEPADFGTYMHAANLSYEDVGLTP